jgi:hypothetical protein
LKKPRHDRGLTTDCRFAAAQDVIEGTTTIEQRGQGLGVGVQRRGGPFGFTAGHVELTVGNLDAEVVLAEPKRNGCAPTRALTVNGDL